MKSLQAFPKEESVTVAWAVPDEYKESYSYNLTWQSSDGPLQDEKINKNKFNIDPLVPGTHYDFSVTTETSDGTKGAPRWTSTCTGMVITA